MLNKLKCLSIVETTTRNGIRFRMELDFVGSPIIVVNQGNGGSNIYRGSKDLIDLLEEEARELTGKKYEALDFLLAHVEIGDTADMYIEEVKQVLTQLRLI
jgi:hypothetical protein